MRSAWIAALLWFSAIGCGVVAGIYFAFSCFIMTALSRIDRASSVAAMKSINTVILRSLFMPLFFGTTLAALALAIVGVFRRDAPGGPAMLAGGIAYVGGMFAVTMLCNVPLNNVLQAVDTAGASTAAAWTRYLREWTAWNHVRTIASTGACALFIAALTAG